MLVCAFTMRSYRVQIMVCRLDPTSEFLLFISVVWTNVSHYKICNYVSNLCSFRHVFKSNKKTQSLKFSMEVTFCDIHGCVPELGNHFCHSKGCILFITKLLRYIVNHQPLSYYQLGWHSPIYRICTHTYVFIVIPKAVSNFQNNFRDSN